MSEKIEEFIGYHGTPSKHVESIKKTGFTCRIFGFDSNDKLNVACDLGNGVYVFLDNEEYCFSGLDCAKSYVKNIKHNEEDFSIFKLTLTIDLDSQEILDLNDEEVIKDFLSIRKKMMPKLEQLFKEKRFAKSPSFERGNFDGIILESLLLMKQSKPVLVLKNTYTSCSYYRQSNFPSGTEACIRELTIIKNSDLHEQFQKYN